MNLKIVACACPLALVLASIGFDGGFAQAQGGLDVSGISNAASNSIANASQAASAASTAGTSAAAPAGGFSGGGAGGSW